MVSCMFMEKRLQKILAEMGIASRRKVEDLIFEQRVMVNGRIATIGMKADPDRDHIKLDGRLLTKQERRVYLMFNKPRQVVTSLDDPQGRPTVKDFLKGIKYRVFPVGRLDFDSEGMLLMTNDGDFAHAVLHPSKKVSKTYLVKVKGVLTDEEIAKLQKGIRLKERLTAPAMVKRTRKTEQNSWLEITIHEGRKRQIRRMLESIGHPVLKLKRIRINGIGLGGLETGAVRYLTSEEVAMIKREAGIV
jgi:23S rRNA pseudouridine2605 synthase